MKRYAIKLNSINCSILTIIYESNNYISFREYKIKRLKNRAKATKLKSSGSQENAIGMTLSIMRTV
jgi:hypothetical protein